MTTPQRILRPTIGRTIWYRSRTGRYSVPAIITATQDTLYQPAIDGGHIHPLESETHVHLTVLTPGIPGERLADTDPNITSVNEGGSYQEFNIPFWDSHMNGPLDERVALVTGPGNQSQQPAGTWCWPVIA